AERPLRRDVHSLNRFTVAASGDKWDAMKIIRRTAPTREPQTEVARVVEEGVTPPPGPPLEPAPDRDLWPWLLLLLVLVIGGIVAAVVLTGNDKRKNSAPGTTLAIPPATTVTVAR